MKKILFSIAIALLMVACAPSSKQEYMDEFNEFILSVSENASKYNSSEWSESDAEYEKFSGEWFEEFKSEMTLEERMQVTAWIAIYNYHKGASNVGSYLEELGEEVNDGINEIGKGIEEFGKALQGN